MKKKTFWPYFIALSQVAILSGLGYSSSPAATIRKISTQVGKLNTRIVLETDAAPTVVRTFYAANTIVLELGQVNLSTQPPVEAVENKLVTGIQWEKTGPEQARLQIQVRERVPYTVKAADKRTIIELNRIQRGPGEIAMEPAVRQRLDKSSGTNAFMTELNVEEKGGRLRFWAKLSGETVSRVFALENPLRLVVDVYNAVYEKPASRLEVNGYGLKRVRVSQFQLNNPRCITRIVFDLDDPKSYELRSDSHEITVTFIKE